MQLNFLISDCIFYTLTIPSLTYPEYLPFQYLFIVGLIGANCLEIRSYLAAIISVERAIATFSPIKFYKYRNNISNFVIYFLVISLGLFCDVVVFGFCKAWPINPECTTLNCATTKCYQNYVSASKIIYCSINFSFCFLLTVKLFVMNCKNTTPISDVRKANILSLTDGLSTIIFELLPTMIFNYGLIDITTLGPITGALRSMGRSIEAIVMYVLMHSQSSHVQTISVESRRE
ncbi:unnamed protein product [Caenorhabditis angaria]|uniref:Serpentine Receptor, class BC (Class B-like) n=1 Tax=Caenorhabditis angaria TaxID=860376 RepID=A0A9P1J0L2_9PELO|nr:unnamed protein product [Caenorhabditis angaria]